MMEAQAAPRHGKGVLVELVGLAGSGKSTLHRLLLSQSPQIVESLPPHVWNIVNGPFYINNIVRLLPSMYRMQCFGESRVSRREIAFMALLNGWHNILQAQVKKSENIIVIDQGPISMMAYLQIWGSSCFSSSHASQWWDQIFKKWIRTLDIVVRLYAPYDTLITRINHRSQPHHLKAKSDQVAIEFLENYRRIYEQILTIFSSQNANLDIFRIDSSIHTPQVLAACVLDEIQSYRAHSIA